MTCFLSVGLRVSCSDRRGAIEHTKVFLENQEESWTQHFMASKKKDDLADSFLQGLSYIRYVIHKNLRSKVPTKRQVRAKKFNKGNALYYFEESGREVNEENVRALMESSELFSIAYDQNYTTVDVFIRDLTSM